MREFLTKGFFGAILGLCIGTSASASIISRSFLDQALTDYATNTALDLKADKADVTDLSDKIGDAWPYGSDMSDGLYNLSWGLYPLEITLENASDLVRFLFGGEIESGINQGGVLNILGASVFYTGAYDVKTGQIDNGFRSLSQLTDGWADSEGNTYLGVKGLNNQIALPEGAINIGAQGLNEMFGKEKSFPVTIPSDYTLSDAFQNLFYGGGVFPSFVDIAAYTMFGGTLSSYWESIHGIKTYKGLLELTKDIGTLPKGITVQGMYEGWTDSESNTYLGVKGLNDKIGTLPSGDSDLRQMSKAFLFGSEATMLPSSLEELIKMLFVYDETTAAFEKIITGYYPNSETPSILGLYPLTNEVKKIGDLPDGLTVQGMYEGWTDSESNTYLGVIGLNDKIGILPTTIPFYEYDANGTLGYNKYPTAEVLGIKDNIGGMLTAILQGFSDNSGHRVLSLPEISTRTVRLSDQIGTLPTEIPNMDSTWARYGFVETTGTPIDLPDTIGGMLAMLFNEDDSYDGLSLRNIMVRILMGFNRIEGLANLTSAYNLVGNSPIVTAVNANTAKIGTVPDGKNLAGMISETDAKIGDLPTEYATVGAALTAMDAKIDARELPSSSDDGQYVLSAKKVGDTITYTWVRMDLTSEEQAQ